MRLPSRRTWPSSTRVCANERVRANLAKTSHLSRRWTVSSAIRCRPLLPAFLLHARLERQQLGEGIVGVDGLRRALVGARRGTALDRLDLRLPRIGTTIRAGGAPPL